MPQNARSVTLRTRIMWACAATLLLFCLPSSAQQSVLGTVTDSTGAVLPGATVTLTNPATAQTRTTLSDEAGNYQFAQVAIGIYRVEAQKAGFRSAVAEDVNVVVNARQRVDLTLGLPQVTQTVEVTAQVPILETDTSSHGQVVNQRQILQIPLNGRDPTNLALLAPGVVLSANDNRDLAAGGREGSFNINGLRSGNTNYSLDGVDNNQMGTSNQGFSYQVVQLAPDAVAEFKIEVNNTNAEYGRGGGAQIVAVSKSGTNSYRGDLWEYLRNTDLNSGGFFRSATKPTLVRNQFGGTLGGPILRNRTFFFLDFEAFRQVTTNVQFASIPTLDDRQGVFSVPVQNPLTGKLYPANAPIPPGEMSAFARKVMALLPAPNRDGRANNFVSLARNTVNIHHEDLRVDHRVSDQWSAFARISNRFALLFSAPDIPGVAGGNSNGRVHVFNEALAAGATWTRSATSLLDFRFGASRTQAGKVPPLSGGPSMLDLFGIAGLPTDPLLTGGLTAQILSGFSQLGRQATNPQWQNPTLFDPSANYTRIHGRHTFKTGYELQWIHTEVQDLNTLYGRDTYDAQFSKPAGGTGPAATYNLADFLFGLKHQYELQTYLPAQMRQRMQFAYFQDTWKARPNLTLNLGLRWEYATPMWEAHNRLSNFDPATNSMLLARDGSMYDRSLMHPQRRDFAPRLGFAYNFKRKIVVRGGYGIYYQHVNRVGSGNILAINGPQVVAATIVQTPGQANFRTADQGYPAGLIDPSTFDPLKATVAYLDPNTHDAYVQSWFFSAQKQLTSNTLFEMAYVGNHALKVLMFVDLNQARPNRTTENTALQQRRPIAAFASISAGLPVAMSNYNALQARLEHRYSRGLYLLNSFTWSKAMDTSTLALENPNNTTAKPQNLYDLRSEYSRSIYNMPVVNATSVVWDLPFGKGRRFGRNSSSLLDGLVGGWQISLVNIMHSGQPINLSYDPPALFQVSANLPTWLGGVQLRPNVTGPIQPGSGDHTNNFFNKGNIALPTDPSRPFGNAGRNVGTMDSFFNTDLAVEKRFRLPRENTWLEFRAEAFNALNKTNFVAPNSNFSSSAFGTIRGTFDARQIQFGLKLYF